MVQVLSKLVPIGVTCQDYVHPWTDSCIEATAGLYLYALFESFRIYTTVYMLTLLMKGKIPTKEDIKKTVNGILQSTAFLSATAFGYSMFLCILRKVFGSYNIVTVSALPAFLSSVFSILIERPSRRTLLSLYVSNVATETLWNMALSRNMVSSVKYGEIAIFSCSIAVLLAFFKRGLHKKGEEERSDSMFSILKFVVGPYEEKDYNVRSSQVNTFHRQQIPNTPNNPSTSRMHNWHRSKSKNIIFHLISQALKTYKRLIYKIKCLQRHITCPHPFSCIHYSLNGATKMFSIGLGLQTVVKLLFNLKKIIKSPKVLREVLFKRQNLNLALFLGGFSGIFRMVMCLLRNVSGRDSSFHAIPAGMLAGIAFSQYQDTTVSLYVFWKMLQITYTLGISKGVLPRVPGFTEFLYCFSTATLFHAALVEPRNLRPSYWKFLHSISGGRIACMSRDALDVWGLETSVNLEKVLQTTKTEPRVQFIGGL